MIRSVAIVGAGQIGYAAATAFAEAGWNVAVLARSQPDWLDPAAHRYERYVVGDCAPPTTDAVVDTIAFDEEDVARYDPQRVGRLIAISSASVYCDAEGRTLDEAAQNGFPRFDCPIREDDLTVAPSADTYSTRKVRMENCARQAFGERTTILRPCAIHGPFSRHPREWWFVKHMLDGRTRIPLAFGGDSRFQTTAAHLIGEAAWAAAANNLGGTFNLADWDSPSVVEMGQAIALMMGRSVDFEGVEGLESTVGRTPWSIPKPMIVDGAKTSGTLGLTPLTYADAVTPAISWLIDTEPEDWRAAFPQLAAYPWDLFDYAAEDAYFAKI